MIDAYIAVEPVEVDEQVNAKLTTERATRGRGLVFNVYLPVVNNYKRVSNSKCFIEHNKIRTTMKNYLSCLIDWRQVNWSSSTHTTQ